MKRLIILSVLVAMLFSLVSCDTDAYVIYRVYPSEPIYYGYGYVPRSYIYINPYHHKTYHNFGYYNPKPHPTPHHTPKPTLQPPTTPPKPTNVPKATVRQNTNPSTGASGERGGSMSGRRH